MTQKHMNGVVVWGLYDYFITRYILGLVGKKGRHVYGDKGIREYTYMGNT